MRGSHASGGRSRNLVLAAMIFAVSMTFIDQTIVSIAVPSIQRELALTSTGVQWAVNGYLLSLAALFAFGGRLAQQDIKAYGLLPLAGAGAPGGSRLTGGPQCGIPHHQGPFGVDIMGPSSRTASRLSR